MHFHKAVAVPPVVLLIEPTHKQQFGHGIKVIIATYVSLVAIDKRMSKHYFKFSKAFETYKTICPHQESKLRSQSRVGQSVKVQ